MAFALFKNHGILGINARNLQYLKPFNRKKAVKMADSKLATKRFLSTRGIPVPKILATIRSHAELERFDFANLPDSFVLKPNAGYGGEGIIVIAKEVIEGVWQKVGGTKITEPELREHIDDILDGEYSIAALPDIAFFEARVNSVEFVPGLKVEGLPDVRVIVHNLIPVMAMLRVPTPESGGKANVHLGGIGLGIDLASGRTTHAVQFNKLLDELPGGIPTFGHTVPHFDEILKIASSAQLHTNLGYLAADIVVDQKEGPVLLEVNARAGLMVQIANLAPLKKRLERIRGLRVDSPEKGVKLGKELFGRLKKKKDLPKKKVVSFVESAEILLGEGSQRVKVELDPTHETSAIDAALAERFNLQKVGESAKNVHLKIILAEERITTVAAKTDLGSADYKIILGRRDLTNFLIDPTSAEIKILPKEKAPDLQRFDFRKIDQKLVEIDKKIKLLYFLKPINLAAEKKRFFTSGKYEPVFHYRKLTFDAQKLLAQLAEIQIPDSPLGVLFRSKKIEIRRKIELLEVRGSSDFTTKSRQLYGFPSPETLAEAEKLLTKKPKSFPIETADLTAEAALPEFKKVLAKYGLKHWKVVLKKDLVADALAGKSGTLLVRTGAKFSPERLRALLAHEIETHILRGENGRQQPFQIFSRGLGNYLETEEGLAIYNQNLFLPVEHEKRFWPILGCLAVGQSERKSFRQVFDFIQKAGFDRERAWKTAVKIKRGLARTAEPGGFTKEAIYFSGFQKIQKFVESGGDLKKLYLGKIKISDLSILEKISEIRPVKLLPEFYSV
ncbi:MAG: tyrosine/phenylalanine carboxypeptidase domain-containing protein [Patescibacteria group bacterium]